VLGITKKNEKMKKNYARRSFISKVTLGLTAMVTLPFLGQSRNNSKDNTTQNSENMPEKEKIRKVKPLSFQWETADPFLFCVHHEDKFPKGNEKMGPNASLDGRYIGQDFILKDGFRMYHGTDVPGFPGHPHRGFETITVVREGLVDHADSTGAAGRYGNGDVQWMTAGKGVQHSEMFPLLNKEKENPLELFQIWLNLPAKSKMVEPHFKMIWEEEVPKFTEKDNNNRNIQLEVLVGKLGNHTASTPPPNSWAFDSNNDVAVWNIQLDPHAEWTLPPTREGINRTLYYYEGNGLQMEQQKIPHYHAVEVEPTAAIHLKNNGEIAKILVLQGRPINEPVVQHGPFVMNTKQEIHEAFEAYQRTRFGGWPWPKMDHVHDRSLGRFAIHSDGRKEMKG
jgi:redox-sensitive bicupin YhaK (pirin superfamily)